MNKQEILFLHTPKVAGSSINTTPLAKSIKYKVHSFKGDVYQKIKEIGAENTFSFGFVRNPYSRFVSLYNYFYKMDENHMFYKYNAPIVNVIRKYPTFNDFCLAFESLRLKGNFHFRPQAGYFESEVPSYSVDFIGKYESLQADYDALCELLNIEKFALPTVNSSGKVTNFMELYSDDAKNIVQDFYERDFVLFDYD